MQVAEHHEGDPARRPHRLPFNGPVGASPQLTTANEKLEQQPGWLFRDFSCEFANISQECVRQTSPLMLSVAMHCWVTRWLVLSTRGASILQLHRGSSSSRSVSPASLPSGKQTSRVRVSHVFSLQFTGRCAKPQFPAAVIFKCHNFRIKKISLFPTTPSETSQQAKL